MAVQRNVPGLAARNDELSQLLLRGAPDQGMVCKDFYRLGDEIHRLQRSGWLGLQQKIGEPAEIRKRSLGINYARQVLALGFEADLP